MVKTRTSTLGAASNVVTGTYTGDGAATQAIIGLGFQPKYVFVYPQVDNVTRNPAQKTDLDGLFSLLFILGTSSWSAYLLDHIISLDADGFTVGDGTGSGGNALNINGRVYTYIAFG